jgi:alpha-2-macroglobulin
VTLAVVGDRLITTAVADVEAGLARIPLTVGKDWGTGAYVVATLRRPLDVKASRMPGRAIGVHWFAIERAAHTLILDMKLPELMRPRETLHVPLRLGGLAPGQEARVVVAAVDVGILNLTNYKPPDPDEYYLGQRQLTAEIRDLYGQLIDGMQGVRGDVRTGGDSGAMELSGSPPTQPPLALYSGIAAVGPDGQAEVSFDLPAFSGTVRVMATAWSADRLGHADGDVIVRDPVVLTTTLPRFLLNGDRASMRLDLDNVEGPAGDYQVQVAGDGPLGLTGSPARTLRLAAGQRRALTVEVAASGVGAGRLAVRVSGPGGFDLARSYPLQVMPANQVLTRRTVKPIAPGESLTLSSDLFVDLVPGTGSVALSVGPSTAFDVAALLKALDRYPFGCSEQIVSRAMPLLYVNELAGEAHLRLDTAVDERVRDSIQRLLARQDSNGSFGLWAAGGNDAWLDAYVTDFLTRARERGFPVPDTAFKLALDRLRNQVATAPEPSKDGGADLAYVLYVLARNGAAPLGDLRYLADAKLADVNTPIARAQIAAALGMLGDRVRAETVYAAALQLLGPQPSLEISRTDFGSALRDAAALVTLASEGGAAGPTVQQAIERVEAARASSPHASTQEEAWLVLAARALGREGTQTSLDVAGERHQGSLYRTFDAADLGAGMKVTNLGDATVQAVVSVGGAPVMPEPAVEQGFKIERRYYTIEGDAVDPSTSRQNQRLVVVLRVTEAQPQFGRIIVVDHLPAGFEIDNPHLVSSGDAGTLSWIEDVAEPASSEFRDDRFAAAFNRKSDDRPVFTVAYAVRAVSPGRYVLPQAYVEDMYRPDRFGRTGTGSVDVVAAK